MIRCPECPAVNNIVPPDIPACNDYESIWIGEAPGQDENRKLRVFIGKTGREVNEHYLPLIGTRRERTYFTNAIKCLPTGTGKLDPKREKDLSMLQSCAECHLYPEIERYKPKLIVPMGAFAVRAIDPDIDLELQHGMPLRTAWGMTFPMYHPAGGIHEPKKMLQIRTDWTRLRKYYKHTLRLPVDRHAGQERYYEVTTRAQVDDAIGDRWNLPLATDTETTRQKKPFCMTGSVEAGTGFLIRAENTAALERLQYHLDRWRGPLLFHNYLFDGDIVEMMGLLYPHRLIIDTMTRAFHLGNIPQGLKALSYRLNGMKMQDFDDLVKPFSSELVMDYYRQAYSEEWEKPEEQLIRDEKTGLWKLYRPQSMHTKLKRFFTDYSKNEEKNIFEMWTKNWKDEQALIEGKVGRWPGKCITHVPFELVLYYACRDADATLRLWPLIKAAFKRTRRKPEVDWIECAA